jgi:Peptidase family M23
MSTRRAAVVLAVMVLVAACDGSSSATPTPTPTSTPPRSPAPAAAAPAPSFGLPFAAGLSVEVGKNGLHADNMRSVDGGVTFTGQSSVPASIDLWVPSGTVVYPVAAGIVRSAMARCNVVVIDHAGGVWSEYLHLEVDDALTDGQAVTTATPLGTVLPWQRDTACDQHSDAQDHLHLAFAQASDENHAAWVEMEGHVLCGHEVDAAGNVGGWAKGDTFVVPAGCAGGATTAQATPMPSPTEPPPVLSGSWVAPKDGKTLSSSTLTLSAKATKTLDNVSVTRVTFTVAWASHDPVKACSAKRADDKGAWACNVDLWSLGAPLDKLTVSFDVFDDAGDVARAPDGQRKVVFASPPPKPANIHVTATDVGEEAGGTWIVKIRWDEPQGAVDSYRLMWVAACPNYPKVKDGSPCLVEHTALAKSELVLIKKLDGDATSATIKQHHGGVDPGGLYSTGCGAIVLGAANAFGSSALAIVQSAKVGPDWDYIVPSIMCGP